MSKIREQNEDKYESSKKEDLLENAILCEKIADENFLWWPDETLHWRKKGIKLRENLWGKKSIENTPYYDKIVKILIEKGSYKEAIKWNKKSADLKIKNKGENTPEIIINKLYHGDSMLLLKEYNEAKTSLDKAYIILNKNESLLDAEFLCEFYLELEILYGRYNNWASRLGIEIESRCDECGLKSIITAKRIYGENSIMTADVMRWKGISTKNRQEALEWFKKSIAIYILLENNEKYARQIFRDIRQKLEGQNLFSEQTAGSLRWFYENSSKEFVGKAIDEFAEADKSKMKELLDEL